MATSATAHKKLLSVGTKIVAVGRNYAAHAKELGNAVPKEPVLFMKPTSSYLPNGGTIEVPQPLSSLDHEVELAVVIGRKARDVSESAAMNYIGGYALALDMTAREIQASAKSAGLPWTVAKGQDTFTPISSVLSQAMVPDPHNLELWLKVDGELRQKGSTADMIFKIPFLISHISSLMTLLEGDVILTAFTGNGSRPSQLRVVAQDGELRQKGSTADMIFKIPFLISHISSLMTLLEGDVILTGTPQGVGPVKVGQKIDAGIAGLLDIHFNVEQRKKTKSS